MVLIMDDIIPEDHLLRQINKYERRFKGTNLYEEIFSTVLERCVETGKVDKYIIFIDSTYVKAAANNKKFVNEEVKKTAKYYEESLKEEINKDREEHHRKPLKENHGFRYTQMRGKAKMEMKSMITFTCVNLKKLVKVLARKSNDIFDIFIIPLKLIEYFFENKNWAIFIFFSPVCLRSEVQINIFVLKNNAHILISYNSI